jgi:transposase
MQTVTTIGLDIAKSVFQIHGIDAAGDVIVRRKLKRRYVLPFFQKLPPCVVGIEACASSHHWSRELQALGHTVRLMPSLRRSNSVAIEAQRTLDCRRSESWPSEKRVAVFASGGMSHFVIDEEFDRKFVGALKSRDKYHLTSIPLKDLQSGTSS